MGRVVYTRAHIQTANIGDVMTRIVFTSDFKGNTRIQDIPAWQAFNLLKRQRWIRSMTVVDGDGEITFVKSKGGRVRVYNKES